jgi:hypothetical protein
MTTTRDTETIYRIFGLEHEGDIVLLPTRKPPPPVRRPVRYDLIRWGRSLGPAIEDTYANRAH